MVVPSGCLSSDKTKWNPSHPYFLIPVRKLSACFRDKLLCYLSKAEMKGKLSIPQKIQDIKVLIQSLKHIPWVVNSQAPKKGRTNPEAILRYLSRYVHKTAVSDKRIIKIENGKVHLGYYDRKRKTGKTEIISEILFMKRLVLHILPKGFKKTRFYGFMANRYRANMLALCRILLGNPLACLEEDKNLLDDTAFLFWKYFRIDITKCPDCKEGHLFIRKLYLKGG